MPPFLCQNAMKNRRFRLDISQMWSGKDKWDCLWRKIVNLATDLEEDHRLSVTLHNLIFSTFHVRTWVIATLWWQKTSNSSTDNSSNNNNNNKRRFSLVVSRLWHTLLSSLQAVTKINTFVYSVLGKTLNLALQCRNSSWVHYRNLHCTEFYNVLQYTRTITRRIISDFVLWGLEKIRKKKKKEGAGGCRCIFITEEE
jgi:hypothetical protein